MRREHPVGGVVGGGVVGGGGGVFFFQAEDGIRDLVRSRGLGDVYKRQLDKSLKQPVDKAIEARAYFWKGELAYQSGNINESIKWYNQYLSLIHI